MFFKWCYHCLDTFDATVMSFDDSIIPSVVWSPLWGTRIDVTEDHVEPSLLFHFPLNLAHMNDITNHRWSLQQQSGNTKITPIVPLHWLELSQSSFHRTTRHRFGQTVEQRTGEGLMVEGPLGAPPHEDPSVLWVCVQIQTHTGK